MRLLSLLLCLVSSSVIVSDVFAAASVARPAYQEPFSGEAVSQMIIGLLLVISLIFVFYWLLKRFSGFVPASQNMKVLGVLPLSAREKAVLVKVGETQMLLGVAPGRVSHLHTFDESVVIESQNSVSFAERLNDVMKKSREQKSED